MKKIKTHIIAFSKEIYSIWFPWLDIAILTFIYFFLWGEHINPYRHYQLLKHGEVVVGKISGESGLYANSDHPRMRDFDYTFALPDGKIIKSSSHTFTLDKKGWKNQTYPVIADISYLPHQPEINWINSDLSDNIGDFYYRNLVHGTIFILMSYLFAMIPLRLSVLEDRKEKRDKLLAKQGRIFIRLPKELLN